MVFHDAHIPDTALGEAAEEDRMFSLNGGWVSARNRFYYPGNEPSSLFRA
jgi:hypothetical protein